MKTLEEKIDYIYKHIVFNEYNSIKNSLLDAAKERSKVAKRNIEKKSEHNEEMIEIWDSLIDDAKEKLRNKKKQIKEEFGIEL